MQVAVYAVECRGSWRVWISLNIAVDRLWWSGAGRDGKDWVSIALNRFVILAPALPLGWAVKLRDSFRQRSGMKSWGAKEWGGYMCGVLESDLREERESGGVLGKKGLDDGVSICCLTKDGWAMNEKKYREERREKYGEEYVEKYWGRRGGDPGDLKSLALDTEQFVEAASGRSLLQQEVEALLAEQLPTLVDWRQAAQLAHLQGRLELTAAVGSAAPAAHGARARQLPAGAGALARAAAKLPHLLPRGAALRRASSRCLRCGSAPTGRTACAACGLAGCAYCEACLALGRSRACALLVRSAALPAVRCTAALAPAVAAGRWGLSAAQAGAADAALGFLAEPRKRSAERGPERFLLWAVTGAGKTEMIFPLLEAVLAAGGRALVATPRRDVVLELAPRLAKAFPAENIAVLYGGSPDRWVSGRLTLATTHQLLRFHQGFDLVIIDELDALPRISIYTRLIVNYLFNGCWYELSFPSVCLTHRCV